MDTENNMIWAQKHGTISDKVEWQFHARERRARSS